MKTGRPTANASINIGADINNRGAISDGMHVYCRDQTSIVTSVRGTALRKPTMSRFVKQRNDSDVDLGALRRRGESCTLVGNGCSTNVAGGGGALHGIAL